MGILKICPMCGKEHHINLSEEEAMKYEMYLYGIGNIQQMLPDLGAVEREFLITGYCHSCQAKIFGTANKPELARWE